MKYVAILFLLLSLKMAAQNQTTAAGKSANAATKPDSLQQYIMQKLEIPSQFTLLSSEVLFNGHGQIFKTWYSLGNSRYNNQAQAFINHAKPKDYIIFENIKVMRDGKIMRWPNKTIKF